MSLTTVAELRSTLGVGTLYSDATLQESCTAADDVLIAMLWANKQFNQAQSNTTTEGVLYFDQPHGYILGQVITIAGNGTVHNGSKTLAAVSVYTLTYAVTGSPAVENKQLVLPYGSVTKETYIDWTLDSAVQIAALEIAVDIWQSRQTSNSGGVSPDFQPSPYRMGNTLLARVRGLIAHALDPRSMVG